MPNTQKEKPARNGGWLQSRWQSLKQRVTEDQVKGRIYKVTRWLLFGVVIGLLPFSFPFVNILVSASGADSIDWVHMRNTLFGRGDLLLIAATLVAASAGDLIGSGREREGGKIIAGFWCFVIFIICVVWYGIIADKIEAKAAYNVGRTARISLWLFSFSVLCSAGCLLLGDEAKKEAKAKQEGEEDE